MISLIIPVYNGSSSLGRCLEAVVASDYPDYECIVVDDGSTDGSREIAEGFPVLRVQPTGGPRGPAYARNRGAKLASGEILYFVDADIVIRPDSLTMIADTFARYPQADALFGCYDDSPEASGFLSQYKNLFHHYVHQEGREEAATFWSGCGAVRREVFLRAGGFNERLYRRPSIEDIELGYRLRASGHRILLNKALQVKHLKRWTLGSLIKSDVFDRAIPWTSLILRDRHLPNDLNLRLSQRLSLMLLCAMLAFLGLSAPLHLLAVQVLLVGLFLVVIGHWPWFEGRSALSSMSHQAVVVMCVLMGLTVGLARHFGDARMLLPMVPLLLGAAAGHWFRFSGVSTRRVLFAAMVLAFAAAFASLLVGSQTWFLVPPVLLSLLIVALNRRFYAFFVRTRGLLFAIAVLPFHLLYLFYSVLAFGLGIGLHLWYALGISPRSRSRAGAEIG